ncbi:VOC family protein [Chryseobacterium phosphatilyticum]|uniref:VOC family protein n=1 Tax=Chryseobacterium phosphatilyticum TaxID=475075 RepID=A0A316XC21_9FLAO|nr:VOC family protein [Chryseobacterium phosphatilyticum]PWN70719.1 VOC family protein [Chryseobacterium phosphatilyticum]
MRKTNPVVYFEIPVTDLKRAEKFYTAVFNFSFEKEIIDTYEMALFPFEEKSSGITGALAKGDVYKPTKEGIIIYFKTESIDSTLHKVNQQGGKILYPKKTDEKHGFAVAEFEDSEGNRIALHQTL